MQGEFLSIPNGIGEIIDPVAQVYSLLFFPTPIMKGIWR